MLARTLRRSILVVAVAVATAELAARLGHVRAGAERVCRIMTAHHISTARYEERHAALACGVGGRGLADLAAAREPTSGVVVAVTVGRRRLRADFPPGASVTFIRGPREGGTAQQRVAGPGRAAVRHAVHNQRVIAALGVKIGRAQELTT